MLGVESDPGRESAYTGTKRAKDSYDMGASQKQFKVEDNLRIRMAPFNRPATKMHSKWSKLYQIVEEKEVLARVEDPDTRESLTVLWID